MATNSKTRSRKKAPAKSSRSASDPSSTTPYAWNEAIAIMLGGIALLHFLALVSYAPRDLPSWIPFSSTATSDAVVSNFIGPVGAVIAGCSYFILGAASYLIPGVLIWWGVTTLLGARVFTTRTLVSFVCLLLSAACLLDYQNWFFQDWTQLYNLPDSAGGLIGYTIGHKVFEASVGTVGSFIVMSVVYLTSVITLTGLHPFQFMVLVKKRLIERYTQYQQDRAEASKLRDSQSLTEVKESLEANPRRARRASRKEKTKPDADDNGEMELPLGPIFPKPKIIDASIRSESDGSLDQFKPAAQFGLSKNSKKGSGLIATGMYDDYELPSLKLLHFDENAPEVSTDTSELVEIQKKIVSTLGTFGIDVSAGDITRGPTITRYEIYPSPGLRVNRITALEADIARATKAERINIIAPIPGKDTVGIEIANNDKVAVPLRELFEAGPFRNSKAKIPLALGKDVYGKTVVADLAQMPHLLIAGATGSGKSVCLNTIIASLLYRFTPDQLRFIMIDPKVVEMQVYNALPHLVVPVVTDPKKVILALRWVVNEMERRYEMFAKVGCRKFDSFNERNNEEEEDGKGSTNNKTSSDNDKKTPASSARNSDSTSPKAIAEEPALTAHHVNIPGMGEQEDDDDDVGLDAVDNFVPPETVDPKEAARIAKEKEIAEMPDHLPYIVVIIDELADLMQTAPADVESSIARIAQKARAAGIHLIVATQTPRADVVTGIIKANIPSRIAFQVSSKIDSRVILDTAGADRLVGKGDMLYLPPGSAQLLRAQGALVSDEEIEDIVEFCSSQGEQQFQEDIQQTLESGGSPENDVSDEDEELIEKCLEVIFQEKKASTSLLQRRLRLGYTRAARMIDILEQRNIIGPGDGARPREILVDLSANFD
ncbi:MAG: DNA translocase FtsK [Verrucomicrobiales bacterium]|nr:DNA translocase FtsK [Verrucomicrobiales bacterium]